MQATRHVVRPDQAVMASQVWQKCFEPQVHHIQTIDVAVELQTSPGAECQPAIAQGTPTHAGGIR